MRAVMRQQFVGWEVRRKASALGSLALFSAVFVLVGRLDPCAALGLATGLVAVLQAGRTG